MAEREAMRAREAEAVSFNLYEEGFKYDANLRERAVKGRVVIRGKDRPWQQSRQGLIKFYLHAVLDDTSVGTWRFFVHDIRSHSGKHRHQGGLAIYVIEGRGWTVVDRQRHDWEEGDLILLPVKLGGCEHQHFNGEPGKPCKWLAMIYSPFKELLGSEMEQKEASPDWKDHA
ncbi:MAG: cupin domain-containing protein [Dehalococcoidia bacterium]|nr:cupin domain-containing protein [Dehalococcoidia bacterium]